MSIGDAIMIIDAVTRLLKVVAWPFLAFLVALWLAPSMKAFISNVGQMTFKGMGVEFTASKMHAVAEALAEAKNKNTPGSQVFRKEDIDVFVSKTVTPSAIRRSKNAHILWVDDNPGNNINERISFESIGIRFSLATSTDAAISLLQTNKYDAVISDMARGDAGRAGFELLEAMRRKKDLTPFVVYCGSNAPNYKTDVRRKGGQGCTNQPDELFEIVLDNLGSDGGNPRHHSG